MPKLSALKSEAKQTIDFKKLSGYQTRSVKRYRYIIKREKFNAIFSSKAQQKLVLDWLIRKRQIEMAVPVTSKDAANLQPKAQIIWPDGERRCSYQIFWPRKAKKTQKGAN